MGKSSPSAPPVPNPVVTAGAQGAANINTAVAGSYLNAVNQSSPFGTVNYAPSGNVTVDGNPVPQWTQTTTLSPQQQGLYDTSTALKQNALNTAQTGLGNVQNTLASPFTLSGLPSTVSSVNAGAPQTNYGISNPMMAPQASGPIQTSLGSAGTPQNSLKPSGTVQGQLNTSNLPSLPGVNDFSAERQKVEDAYLGRFNTDIAHQQSNTESLLNARGLQSGSEAWNTAQDALNRERVDARNQAIQAGGAEQSRLFGLASQARGQLFGENQAAGNFANAAQGQQFGQNLASGQFGNNAQQQLYQQLLSSGVFGNQAQSQQFGQNEANANLYNAAAGQATQQNQNAAGFYNTAQQQGFGNQMQNATLQNQARQQGIAEQSLLRSQPINELSTLLGLGGQVQAPQGAPNFGIGIAPTDVLGAYGLSQQARQNAYNGQLATTNSNNQAAAGLGSAALMAMLLA